MVPIQEHILNIQFHICGLLCCQISRKSYGTPRLTTVGGLLINKSCKQHCIGNKPYDPISINAISLNFRLTYLFNWYVEENTINHIITKLGFLWILAKNALKNKLVGIKKLSKISIYNASKTVLKF